MRSQRDMFTQLPKEFALAAAKTLPAPGGRPSGHQRLGFPLEEGRNTNDSQSTAAKAAAERETHLPDIRLIDQMPAQQLGHAVLIDTDMGLLRHG